jgi:antitoxin component of MazEF toxin-antitoxin module
MQSRSIIKKGNSLYVCLPSSVIEALEIKRGDRCQFLLLPGYGMLLRKDGGENRFPGPMEAIANLQQAADEIVDEAVRKMKGMENQVVFHIWEKIFGLCLKDGLVNIFPPIAINEETRKLLFDSREGKDVEENE